MASVEEIALFHDADYIRFVQLMSERGRASRVARRS
jgi:hypothetical protein